MRSDGQKSEGKFGGMAESQYLDCRGSRRLPGKLDVKIQ